MIFEMVDGRNYFYQWDLNRQLKVNDSSIKEVHFCNRTDSCSLVVAVVNGYVNVPNVILQSQYDFRAFGYDGEATLHEASFKVKPRTRPADYVYTEEQEYTIEAYIERAVEEAKATGNFQGDKGEKGDTGPQGPKGDTGEKGEKGETGEAGIMFVTKDNDRDDIKAILRADRLPVYTNTLGTDSNKYCLPLIYKNGENYYFGGVRDNLYLTIKYDGYEETWGSVTSVSYATKEYLDNELSNLDIPEADVDLTNYYTKEEVNNLIPDTSNFITEVPAEYITETELNAKGYLTEHQSLADYAKKSEIPSIEGLATEEYVDNAISNIEIPDDTEVIELDFGSMYQKTITKETATKIAANPDKCVIKVTYGNNIKGAYYTFSKLEHNEGYSDDNFTLPANDTVYYSALVETGVSTEIQIIASTLRFYIAYESDNTTVSSTRSAYITTKIIDSDYGGAVSYLENQYLTDSQKNQAKKNLALPYILDSNFVYDSSTSLYSNAGYRYFSGSFTELGNAPVGTKFTLTLEVPSASITETVECEITSIDTYSNYTVLTDCTDLIFFSGEGNTVSSSRVYINKKDTNAISTSAISANLTASVPVRKPMNVLNSELVDLSNYYTKDEINQAIQDAINAINNIGNAEGGAY